VLGGHLEDHDTGTGGSYADGLCRRLEGDDRLRGLYLRSDALPPEGLAERLRLRRSHPDARLLATGQISE
jgi:hypothetical protein